MSYRSIALLTVVAAVAIGPVWVERAHAQRSAATGPLQQAGAPEAEIIEANADALGLDADTLVAVKATAEAGRTAAKEQFEAMGESRKRIQALLREPLPDAAALLKEVDVLGSARTENMRSRVRTSLKIRSLLTEEQRTKFAELRTQRPERRGASLGAPIGPPPAMAVDRKEAGP